MPTMRRMVLWSACAAALVGCNLDVGNPNLERLLVTPILDSLFVGDTVTLLKIAYYNDHGDSVTPPAIRWSSGTPAVASVDSVTGKLTAVGPGFTVVSATTGTLIAQALVVVTRQLQLDLLLDTIYLMPGDTFTVPVQVRKKGGAPPAAWFSASPNAAVYTVDSATGRITAVAAGAPLPFVVHADTLVDSGSVQVMILSDTSGGKAYYTVFGTYIDRANVGARALNYVRPQGKMGFRFRAAHDSGASVIDATVITLTDQVLTPQIATIDSISPVELNGAAYDPFCRPINSWGSWSKHFTALLLQALSRPNGTISITQVVPINNGRAVSGRFLFLGQRTDEYFDPNGILPIRGTFVAPLVTDSEPCGG